MTALLAILGAVVTLAPTHLRLAHFERDTALALYTAESGLNHGIGLIRTGVPHQLLSLAEASGEHGGENGGEGEAKTMVTVGPLNVGPDETDGQYTLTFDRESPIRYTLTSLGEYQGRRREISVTAWQETIFIDYIVDGDNHPEFAYLNYDVKTMAAPEDANWFDATHSFENYRVMNCAEFRNAALVRGGGVGLSPESFPTDGEGDVNPEEAQFEHLYVRIDNQGEDCRFERVQSHNTYRIARTTVYLHHPVHNPGFRFVDNGTTLQLDETTFFMDGDLRILANDIEVEFRGEHGSNLYIQGDVVIEDNNVFIGRKDAHEDPPWNTFFISGGMTITANNPELGPVETTPDVLFLFGSENETATITFEGNNLNLSAGIYAPTRSISFTAPGIGNVSLAGSIVGKSVTIDPHLAQQLYDNWLEVRDRMQSVPYPENPEVRVIDWRL